MGRREIILSQMWSKVLAARGSKVKFYTLDQEYNFEPKRIELFREVNALIALRGHSSVVTPLFSTYNMLLQRTLICYPHFGAPWNHWLAKNNVTAAEHTLPPRWKRPIMNVARCIIAVKELEIGRFDDESSYVEDTKTGEIKIILFPIKDEGKGTSYFFAFGEFLHQKLFN